MVVALNRKCELLAIFNSEISEMHGESGLNNIPHPTESQGYLRHYRKKF